MMKDFTDLKGYTWKFPVNDNSFINNLLTLKEYQLKQKMMIVHRPHLIDLSWVLDIGANVGLWTRWFKENGAGKIDCFEPVPETAECLRRNTRDLADCNIHEIGLSDTKKTLTLYNVAERPDSGFYTSTPYKTFLTPYLEIQCEKLDDLNMDPTFIKVDIQGGEMDFLLGAEQTIRRCKPGFMIEGELEDPNQETLTWLKELGYRLECATSSDYLMVAA
jgi:FkbM family methyltransferase